MKFNRRRQTTSQVTPQVKESAVYRHGKAKCELISALFRGGQTQASRIRGLLPRSLPLRRYGQYGQPCSMARDGQRAAQISFRACDYESESPGTHTTGLLINPANKGRCLVADCTKRGHSLNILHA